MKMFSAGRTGERRKFLHRCAGGAAALAFSLFLGGIPERKGLAAGSPSEDSKPLPGRIVILGDSITAGYGLRPAEAYPALLQAKLAEAGLRFEVVSAGVSGDTTAGGLRRVKWAMGKGAAVFVLALGGNDGLRGVPTTETEQNLRNIIREVRNVSPRALIVIAGMRMPANLGRAFVDSFDAVFERVARENDALLVPFLLEGVGGVPSLNQPDLIHPTAEGQKRVAENVWKILGPALLKETGQTSRAATGGGSAP